MGGKWYRIAALGVLACIMTGCGSRKPANESKSEKVVVWEKEGRAAETVSLERINQKVSPKLPLGSQIKTIIKEKAKWWWEYDEETDADRPYFAVTDFDQDGYLELLALSDKNGDTVLYEVNERGDALERQQVSGREFGHIMENPLGAYYEEKTDSWYYGEEGLARYSDSTKNTYIKKMYMQYELETLNWDEEEADGGFTYGLTDSWEEFAVYEPLDVSSWQTNLTTGEQKQLRRIAETMANFGTVDSYPADGFGTYHYDYAVCDLNQDGTLEVLVRFLSGSGIIRTHYLCYEVREEEGVLNKMDEAERISHPEKYGITGMEGFAGSQWDDSLSVYRNSGSGETYYGFEAAKDGGSSDWQDYKIQWNGHYLSIHPMKEEEKQRADKKGEAHIRWVARNSMANSGYQYENALASYLGWGIRWKSTK